MNTGIITHCATTQDGRYIGKDPAKVIDTWHKQRGYQRSAEALECYNSELKHIGYHWVIDIDGVVYAGRHMDEQGAHVKGHNKGTIGLCLTGTRKFTIHQWRALRNMVEGLARSLFRTPGEFTWEEALAWAESKGFFIKGHNEFANKECPGFSVQEWPNSKCQALSDHIIRTNLTEGSYTPAYADTIFKIVQ